MIHVGLKLLYACPPLKETLVTLYTDTLLRTHQFPVCSTQQVCSNQLTVYGSKCNQCIIVFILLYCLFP